MTCKHFKDWLYLYGEGELTSSQKQKLQRHLANCPDCRSEQRAVAKTADRVRQSRMTEPIAPDPEVLTQHILEQISAESLIAQTPVTLDRWFGFFFKPVLRMAMSLTVLFIMGVFALQSISLLNKVSQLEDRVAIQRAGSSSMEPSLASLSETGDGWVLTRVSSIQRLIQQHHPLSIPGGASFWRRIQGKIPDIGDITLEDGLSKHEILLLLKHQEEILKLLPNL